jgi:hypothetical protein
VPFSPTATNRDFVADQVTPYSGLITEINPLEVTVPEGEVTVIGPRKLPITGTENMICVLDALLTDIVMPLIVTVLLVVKFVPVTVIAVPGEPIMGVKLVIVGTPTLPPPPLGELSQDWVAGGMPQKFVPNVISELQPLCPPDSGPTVPEA